MLAGLFKEELEFIRKAYFNDIDARMSYNSDISIQCGATGKFLGLGFQKMKLLTNANYKSS